MTRWNWMSRAYRIHPSVIAIESIDVFFKFWAWMYVVWGVCVECGWMR